MSRLLVSIVIPFLNHGGLIKRTLMNLFKQSYYEWEAILVDNGSSDGSREIALSSAERYGDRVRYVYQEIRGIPYARNKGLDEARGKYVSFLDVDDKFTPSKLSDQVPILEKNHDVAMVYGLTRRIYLPSGRAVIQDVGLAQEGVNQPPYLAIDWLRIFYRLPQTGATLVRTSIARKIGGFPENLLMGNDDVAFHLKLALDYKIWFLPKEAVLYHRHSSSKGSQLNQEYGVIARYFDAYASWVVPYTFEYETRTGDSRPRYWAERALARNLVEYAYNSSLGEKRSHRSLMRKILMEQQNKGYLQGVQFRFVFFFWAWFPYRIAKLACRVFYRGLFLMLPKRFPPRIPGIS